MASSFPPATERTGAAAAKVVGKAEEMAAGAAAAGDGRGREPTPPLRQGEIAAVGIVPVRARSATATEVVSGSFGTASRDVACSSAVVAATEAGIPGSLTVDASRTASDVLGNVLPSKETLKAENTTKLE